MTAVAERTTADLLLEWDRTRPRSQQRELGWSEVGGCRRRAGYRLAGTEPSNPGGSLQAVMGTAIHDAVQQRLNETAGPDDLVEYEVVFAGIPGHLDRFEADTGDLIDVKTTSSRWLEHVKVHGPDKPHLWQTHGYWAALRAKGIDVRRIVIDYLARDTGELYRWTTAPNIQHVRDALAWLESVRSVDVDMTNRDYAPDSGFCQHCPFYKTCWDGATPGRDPRSVLYVEDPDAGRWARQLADARAAKKAAEAAEKEAKGALDALHDQDNVILDVGLGDGNGLLWQTKPNNRIDGDVVRAEYARVGAKVPLNEGTRTELRIVPLPKRDPD